MNIGCRKGIPAVGMSPQVDCASVEYRFAGVEPKIVAARSKKRLTKSVVSVMSTQQRYSRIIVRTSCRAACGSGAGLPVWSTRLVNAPLRPTVQGERVRRADLYLATDHAGPIRPWTRNIVRYFVCSCHFEFGHANSKYCYTRSQTFCELLGSQGLALLAAPRTQRAQQVYAREHRPPPTNVLVCGCVSKITLQTLYPCCILVYAPPLSINGRKTCLFELTYQCQHASSLGGSVFCHEHFVNCCVFEQ